jgi:predicted extracellular nuclease
VPNPSGSQTLDHLFVTGALYDQLVQMRAAHINADWAAPRRGRLARLQ